ncbi:hypothetical protein ONS95_013809 [Cadophora gregata]|uniref:uncharacterized protein n=1 Tax=Cadophora gregata TaxID=51156 RepID=UPI0026DD9ED0|nr:uncharacterized protein ONS95_013809 [Cadophora gregata]KAK0113558.1 hypothetical protein ONS96_014417 [Cadophora gregata f. sp. sojae]KAK0114315.1 hypothetical protein ONS95_013809 [Cadophora gregata]
MVYRGACTDRTFKDPSCNEDICVTGFETTWQWAVQCEGSSDILCGTYEDAYHALPTCSASAATVTTGFQTTRSTTTAGRYTPPPSLDTSRFTVITSSYTTIITATAQTTTRTSTFESTTTSAIAQSAIQSTETTGKASSGSGTAAGASSTGTSPPKSSSSSSAGGAVTLTTGVLVAVIVGPILAIAICIGIFLFIRKRRAAKKNEAIRLNSANYPHPPPNGPVGADQVYPYEVDVNQASGPPRQQFNYYGPKVDTHEVDAQTTVMKEKTPAVSGVAAMQRPYHEDLRSPAPTYTEALMPVEMDATPSVRSQTRQ